MFALAATAAIAAGPFADPPQAKSDKAAGDPAAEANEAHRREAEKVIRTIAMEVQDGETWTKVKPIEKPLLYYGDLTRENDRGSLWGWSGKGRPAALIELYQHTKDRTKWVYAACNISGKKLRASRSDAAWWRENNSASEFKDIPGAPNPAAEAPQRQRQIKLLAQKFTAHELWDPNNTRYDLRRLERPLLTYRDEAAGILDGALFIFANGTNPEIILLLEARQKGKDGAKPVWQYAVGRLAHAELHLAYGGKEVFEAPRGHLVSAADRPYWLGFITSAAVPEP